MTRTWLTRLAGLLGLGSLLFAPVQPAAAAAPTPDALWQAVLNSRVDEMRQILQAAPALAKGKPGESMPLHFAAESGQLDTVELLLAAGTDPNTPDKHGQNPLHHAARGMDTQPAEVERLVIAGAKLEARDRDGATPLLAMALKEEGGRSAEIVPVFVRVGADPKATNAAGRDAMAEAAFQLHPKMVESLEKIGVPLTAPAAVAVGRVAVVREAMKRDPKSIVRDPKSWGERRLRGASWSAWWPARCSAPARRTPPSPISPRQSGSSTSTSPCSTWRPRPA